MKCYPLGVAAHIATALDCIRRGELEAAAATLQRAAELARREGPAEAARGPGAQRSGLAA